MSVYQMDLPKFELLKITDLQPYGNDLIIIPATVPEVAATSGKDGKSILVLTGDDNSAMNFERMPLRYGVVHKIGKDVTRYKEGDKVYFHKLAGQDGDTLTGSFLQMSETDVFGFAEFEMKEI